MLHSESRGVLRVRQECPKCEAGDAIELETTIGQLSGTSLSRRLAGADMLTIYIIN